MISSYIEDNELTCISDNNQAIFCNWKQSNCVTGIKRIYTGRNWICKVDTGYRKTALLLKLELCFNVLEQFNYLQQGRQAWLFCPGLPIANGLS